MHNNSAKILRFVVSTYHPQLQLLFGRPPNNIEILILKFYWLLFIITNSYQWYCIIWMEVHTHSAWIYTNLETPLFSGKVSDFFRKKAESFKFQCQYIHNFLSSVVALKITSSIFPLIRLSSFYLPFNLSFYRDFWSLAPR